MTLPEWTTLKPGAETHGGRWPLGLESLGQRVIAQHLMPGVTNGTKRIRYYAFFSWIYWAEHRRLQTEGVREVTVEQQDMWRRRMENAMRAATLLAGEGSGLIGVDNAVPVPDRANARFPLVAKDPTTAWTPAAYQASCVALGSVALRSNLAVVRGRLAIALAEAFDAGLRKASGRSGALERLLSDSATIAVSDLERLHSALALRALDETDADQPLALELLFRLEPDLDENRPAILFHNDWRRSRSMTLLLEAVRQAKGEFVWPYEFHGLFATGKMPDGRTFKTPSFLARTMSYWRRYQERQHEKVGIYAIWREVGGVIGRSERESRPLSGDSVVRQVVARAHDSGTLREWLGPNGLRMSVSGATDRIMGRLREEASDPDTVAYELADSTLDRTFTDYAGTGIVVLLLQAELWRTRVAHVPPEIARIHEQAHAAEVPLGHLTRTVEGAGEMSVAEFLAWCAEHLCITQSLRVALQKLPQDRYFIARDEDGYRIVQPQKPSANLVFDPPRVASSLSLMSDLGLVRAEENYEITSAGESLLERALAFHEEAKRQEDGQAQRDSPM
jgi:hypothetical protein